MKKNWIAPVVESLELSATQHGGTENPFMDGVFVHADGSLENEFAPVGDDDDDEGEGELS